MDEDELRRKLRNAIKEASEAMGSTGDPLRAIDLVNTKLENEFNVKILEEDESPYSFQEERGGR